MVRAVEGSRLRGECGVMNGQDGEKASQQLVT